MVADLRIYRSPPSYSPAHKRSFGMKTAAKLQKRLEAAKKVEEKFGGNGKNAYSTFVSRAFN